MKPLILSIDLDEFYHVRWVTGSAGSIFPSVDEFFKTVYKQERPRGDLEEQTRILIKLFKEYGAKCTFFILGEVALNYPNLIKQIAEAGHEIACHGMAHKDLTLYSRDEFIDDVIKARGILESFTCREINGFRIPNLIIEDWVKKELAEIGFKYDSSICPSRPLKGKFGLYSGYPNTPYVTDENSFKPGNGNFWEFPLPVFPLLKLPGATGNVTRAFGPLWTKITHLNASRSQGVSHYYFHPWEIGEIPEGIKIDTFYKKLFTRRTGKWMLNYIRKLLKKYRCCSCMHYLKKIKGVKEI
ncbi:MAG: polysaccharide deacetylase family protein [bacterium]